MNEQDREALSLIVDAIGDDNYCDWKEHNTASDHLRARLDYTDKLERALAWFLKEGGIDDGAMLVVPDPSGWITEPHDGTPRDRGEALVRLWARVTGSEL